jgi:DNA repair exonuclease SbcCD ATPase subunit
MKISMTLIKLTLVGSRKNYSVKFKKGLNFISGHTSTGKTSILEMIDYALGAKKHKHYIEIGNSCSKVELELLIGDKQFLIRRKLFLFSEPIIIESWDEEQGKYLFYARCVIDVPSNKNSLSAFLIEKFNMANITIGNDTFSFRDLFKYSYLKQTEIDNENIMQESDWVHNKKRIATFEIIFNFFNEQLTAYRKTLKIAESERDELKIRLNGIREFLDNAEIANMNQYIDKTKKLTNEIANLRSNLAHIKKNKGIQTSYSAEVT